MSKLSLPWLFIHSKSSNLSVALWGYIISTRLCDLTMTKLLTVSQKHVWLHLLLRSKNCTLVSYATMSNYIYDESSTVSRFICHSTLRKWLDLKLQHTCKKFLYGQLVKIVTLIRVFLGGNNFHLRLTQQVAAVYLKGCKAAVNNNRWLALASKGQLFHMNSASHFWF